MIYFNYSQIYTGMKFLLSNFISRHQLFVDSVHRSISIRCILYIVYFYLNNYITQLLVSLKVYVRTVRVIRRCCLLFMLS